ncbi:MAG: cupin domain-containing protein [Acidobacteriota bacterium]
MSVIQHSALEKFDFPGIIHQTIASEKLGVNGIESWMQTVAPQSGTPAHKHDCPEVVVILRGQGQLILDGETSTFTANSTLLIPAGAVHQILNTGDEEMQLIGTFNQSPVRVYTAEGDPINLPW